MKNYNTLYYLLFVLLIMGSFASMAQNDYGITILGLVAFSFCLLFFFQLIDSATKQNAVPMWNLIELVCLSVLSMLMGFRVFYIHFVLVEWIFGVFEMLLVLFYLNKMIETYRAVQGKNQWLARLVLCFHLSIIIYTLSMITVPFFTSMAEPAGAVAFILLILFVTGSYLKKDIMLDGEKVSGFTFVGRFKDRSVIVLSLFLLFTFYMGLTKVDVLPPMYSDEFPKSYFQLVNQAEKGLEKRADNKLKHEDFKEKYDRFVERHAPE